jgi:hypothetical protein
MPALTAAMTNLAKQYIATQLGQGINAFQITHFLVSNQGEIGGIVQPPDVTLTLAAPNWGSPQYSGAPLLATPKLIGSVTYPTVTCPEFECVVDVGDCVCQDLSQIVLIGAALTAPGTPLFVAAVGNFSKQTKLVGSAWTFNVGILF